MSFEGEVAVVTGGSGGLGAATVRRLHAAGASVVIADLNDEAATALADELGDRVAYVKTDVLDDDSVQAALDKAAELGTLRYAVITHGGYGALQKIVNKDGSPHDRAVFAKTIDLYLVGTFNVLRLASAEIAKLDPKESGERGAVVMTSSIAGYEGQMGQAAYGAAKAGVIGLTISSARDLSSVGIRVNSIAPGTMATPIMKGVGEAMLARFTANIPFPKRLGEPDEFAALAQHLLENTYLNGEVIRIDGAQRFTYR
ncbi:SDR family oxidoreductase [Gordonia sp. (in: high G+C Gram-positive bacteria)]|jgi:NAD(P)-dependent dehydrogenase (short-subunit alcohol dehydrogenase family)|uniref:SDR family oxidoreductase n=3 Tax=Gordonia sp. (in: high G+C Gram-positive bacteria) TaxID=84139 RepID=UPI0026218F3C|nr:SDR family oxidoreductase [Gordonia sp. (in: high G+C Gram-positive bacteria)]HMS75001.1 SDR family oxidoreductase [Gordonia sp. (in: high G+C Gram-positive bacteria)]